MTVDRSSSAARKAVRREVRLRRDLADARSGRVVWVSHCLLNQNTRYLGGATCPGVVVDAITQYVDDGVGIVQMPCPEQRFWGGVLKRRFLWLLDHPRVARRGHRLVSVVAAYLKFAYQRMARRVTREIKDYVRSGFQPVAVVGVAGSPTCGVESTLDLETALLALASCPKRLSAHWMNQDVVSAARCNGQGLFIQCLESELIRRSITVPLTEHGLE